ncbi:MAG: NfeD family protein, partial [Cellvibrionaceae bacterium]|nr:NfeD family protein [Cellvibrionaceae bacterium]
SVIATWVYWSRFRNINQATDQPLLNSAEARLLDKHASLISDTQAGEGKVQIGDALWQVQCDQDLPEGSRVKVVAVEGMTLKVVADPA